MNPYTTYIELNFRTRLIEHDFLNTAEKRTQQKREVNIRRPDEKRQKEIHQGLCKFQYHKLDLTALVPHSNKKKGNMKIEELCRSARLYFYYTVVSSHILLSVLCMAQ